MADNLVVGTAECPIERITEILSASNYCHYLYERWNDVSFELELTRYQVTCIKHDLNRNSLHLAALVRQLLEFWVANKGKDATLGELIRVLEISLMRAMAEELQQKFNLLSENP